MRRLIAFFLLVLMPLQAVWAAAEPYCPHEHSVQTTHLEHHPHEHHTQSDDAPLADDPVCTDHADCHACHGHCVALPQFTGLTQAITTHRGLVADGDARVPEAPVALPDRPNWSSLA